MYRIIKTKALSLTLLAMTTITLIGTSSAQKTYSKIEQMSGWQHCTVCAGTAGQGDTALYSMTRGQSSPSLDGNSTKFWLGGTNNYTNALWWKQLGANNNAHHFVYDVYFYLKTPGAAQALEFDVNQSTGTKKFIFGTQCSMKRGYFDIWAASTSWIHTSIPCSAARTAYKWHHLVWEFQRTSDNRVKFVSVTLNGNKHYVNKTYSPKSSGSKEINVAFQMDGDRYQTDYNAWLDKVTLKYW